MLFFAYNGIFLCVLNRGDDYKNHIKCISEDQKYGGKGYEAKASKGDVKQQQWIQVNCSETAPSDAKELFSSFSNSMFLLL